MKPHKTSLSIFINNKKLNKMAAILVRIGTPVTTPLRIKDNVTGEYITASFANTRVDMSASDVVTATVSPDNSAITWDGLIPGSITVHIYTDATYVDSSGATVTEPKDVIAGVDSANPANPTSLEI